MLREFLRLTPPGSMTSLGTSPGSPVPAHGGFCGSGCGEHSVGLGAPGEDRQQEGAPGFYFLVEASDQDLYLPLLGAPLGLSLSWVRDSRPPDVCASELQKLTRPAGAGRGGGRPSPGFCRWGLGRLSVAVSALDRAIVEVAVLSGDEAGKVTWSQVTASPPRSCLRARRESKLRVSILCPQLRSWSFVSLP